MRYLIIIFALLGLSACATVNNSSYDHFRIDSVPQGAKVTTSIKKAKNKRARQTNAAEYYGCEPTPCAIALPRHSKFIATVTHPGYEPAEIYIRSSSRKGAFAGSMVATTATVAGTTAASAATTAALIAIQAEIASIVITSVANSFTFGAIPVSSTAISTASTSSVMASAVPPALIVSGGMLLVDAASGANKNLFPNPVILGLAREGQTVKTDPFVLMYREEIKLRQKAAKACVTGPAFNTEKNLVCTKAKLAVTNIQKKQKEVTKLIEKAQKEAAKAAKAETVAAKQKTSYQD